MILISIFSAGLAADNLLNITPLEFVWENDLALKSPGEGLPPYLIEEFYGKILRSSLKPDQFLSFEHIQKSPKNKERLHRYERIQNI